MEKSFKKLATFLTTLKMDGIEKLDPKNAKLVEFLDCTHVISLLLCNNVATQQYKSPNNSSLFLAYLSSGLKYILWGFNQLCDL